VSLLAAVLLLVLGLAAPPVVAAASFTLDQDGRREGDGARAAAAEGQD